MIKARWPGTWRIARLAMAKLLNYLMALLVIWFAKKAGYTENEFLEMYKSAENELN